MSSDKTELPTPKRLREAREKGDVPKSQDLAPALTLASEPLVKLVEAWAYEAILKSAEINVETFKGAVQLSGFVGTQSDIDRAIRVTQAVSGVRTVKNDMRLK